MALLAPNLPGHAPSERASLAIFGRRGNSRRLSVNQYGSKELKETILMRRGTVAPTLALNPKLGIATPRALESRL